MIEIEVPVVIDGNEQIQKEVFYTIRDFPYKKLLNNGVPLVTQNIHSRDNKPIAYYNIECAFDIETTTMDSLPAEGIKSPFAFMYLCAFCIGSDCVYMRNWKDVLTFLERLRDNLALCYHQRIIIYVFNLPFEFMFSKNFIKFSEVFGKKKKQPMKAFADEYGVEFRCAWALTNMSFDKACQSSKYVLHKKMVGSTIFPKFNYDKIRTPYTKLENHEYAYMYNDVRGLCELVKEHRFGEMSGKIIDIPLTSTSYTRRLARKSMQKNKINKAKQKRMALNAHEFKLLQDANRGGYVHSNFRYANQIIDTGMLSDDMKSAYLYAICCMRYPMSKLMRVDPSRFYDYIDDDSKACFFRVVFRDLEKINSLGMPYLSYNNCTSKMGVVQDRGKVLKAKMIECALTDLDFKVIQEQYTWNEDEFYISDLYICKKDYLPKELIEVVIKLFENKCFYENKDKYIYNSYKKLANCIFGMMVTNPIPDHVEYDPDTCDWEVTRPKELEEIESSLQSFYNSHSSFLTYQWGVYTTSAVRYLLFKAILAIGEDNVYYCDTDCVKYKNNPELREKLKEVNAYIWEMAEQAPILPEVTVDGKLYRMGLFCPEKTAIRAKMLGPKQYACEYADPETGEIYTQITVAGLSKEKGSAELTAGNQLDDFYVGKTLTTAGKPVAYYNEWEPRRITVQGKSFWTASNIALVNAPYTIGKTDTYKDLLSKK